ncbi:MULTISPECIES: fumarylacetoacetate hydrolase family protein [unclassified Beijerinckia]|uniref:fumarylacetoacetate hydrolase family protein n=1 Tax=unclassified Beijerinckia TaxID=2638183 RepID=UPI000898967E|nr:MULTISPECIES: fumarylacetoacetate hydrolase family protein [unclassified Beijerinckia]MDH7795864.1 2-keto-4-pentenoate hydratase/2-oxohepta-3-ene-1,7-dioic acid hydratase in catechol pathway [Beijerinckia sp. GAS462]SEC19740.1 Fumarylacetoacetate (FAA) hydrolase family protein [Beijerinckia sp. 28-YEA-48]
MKLVTYQHKGKQRAGAFIDGDRKIIDLAEAHSEAFGEKYKSFASVLAMIEAGDAALDRAYETLKKNKKNGAIDRKSVKLLAPIQPPPQIRDCLCFEQHLKQAFAAARQVRANAMPDPKAALAEFERNGTLQVPKIFYEQPIYYKANRFSVIGTEEDVVWPAYSKLMDFELEFGFYIRKKGVDISRDKARDYIYGYTIFNDFSARDAQTIEMAGQLGPAKGKDFDNGNAMGPCLVTADELKDPYKLTMICRVNGEEWGRGSSSTMHWKFEDLIAHVSRSETLYPGEFFGSGTVGNGCGLEQMRFLKHGDVVELEVEGIGVLRNRVLTHK